MMPAYTAAQVRKIIDIYTADVQAEARAQGVPHLGTQAQTVMDGFKVAFTRLDDEGGLR